MPTYRDISDCHDCISSVTGIECGGARNTAKHLQVRRTVLTTRNYEVQETNSADGEEPYPKDTKSTKLLLIL